MAAVLAAMHPGMTNQVDPGPAIIGNGYDQAPEDYRLPNHWAAAIEALKQSELMRDYLGDRFVTQYCTVKEVEMARFMGEVTELDRSEEHTSELQSLMRISYAVFCLKTKIRQKN